MLRVKTYMQHGLRSGACVHGDKREGFSVQPLPSVAGETQGWSLSIPFILRAADTNYNE